MHYRHWVRRNRGKNLKCVQILRISGVKVNLYVKTESIRPETRIDNVTVKLVGFLIGGFSVLGNYLSP